MIDLAPIPTELLQAELQKRKKRRGHPGVLAPCAKCGKVLTAVERRRRCPQHTVVNSPLIKSLITPDKIPHQS